MRLLIATWCALALSACGSSGDSGDTGNSSSENSASDDRPTVALIMKSLANEFFITMADGARQHQSQSEGAYDLIVNGIKNEVDLAQQVALIDQMIASGVDAIVIAPADSKAVVPALARAMAAGLVVVYIDLQLESDILFEYELRIPFVGPDNFAGAEEVGNYLAATMQADQSVAILEGVSTTYNSQRRTAGFLKAMNDAGINVVAQQSAQWDQTAAVTVTSGILVQHPELDAILAANDNMALGAVAAITQSGRGDAIKVVGFDNISAVQELIREGRILATADQHADLLAVYGVEFALEALSGGATQDNRTTPVDLVTIDSLD